MSYISAKNIDDEEIVHWICSPDSEVCSPNQKRVSNPIKDVIQMLDICCSKGTIDNCICMTDDKDLESVVTLHLLKEEGTETPGDNLLPEVLPEPDAESAEEHAACC